MAWRKHHAKSKSHSRQSPKKCQTCGLPSVPGLKKGVGLCQYHYNRWMGFKNEGPEPIPTADRRPGDRNTARTPRLHHTAGELAKFMEEHRSAVAIDEGGFEVDLKGLKKAINDLDYMHGGQGVVRDTDVIRINAPVRPSMARKILKNGHWGAGGPGEDITHEDRKALETLARIEDRDTGRILIYSGKKAMEKGHGAYPDIVVQFSE